MKQKEYDVVIVGGGPGGYTAALYAARSGFSVLVLEKLSPGGQMATTEQIDNYPGFEDGIDGYTLATKMKKGADRFGVETAFAQVEEMELTSNPKKLITSEGEVLGRTVILAMGASPRELDVPGEQEMRGHGVAYCAACDGMMYKNKTVVIAGGGSTAAADAILLSKNLQRSTSGSPQGPAPRITDLYRAAEQQQYYFPLEHTDNRSSSRKESHRSQTGGCQYKRGVLPSL